MKRLSSRQPPRPPRAAAIREPRAQPTSVFRDFLRQLERLDAGARKPKGEGSR